MSDREASSDDRDHARHMLAVAERDLRALEGMMRPAADGVAYFDDSIFGFHAQQAVEKSMKALLAADGHRYTFTHKLLVLAYQLREAGRDVTRYEALMSLSAFAVVRRYDGADAGDGSADVALDRPALLAAVRDVYARAVAEVG